MSRRTFKNLDYYANFVKGVKFGNKKRVNSIIDLYNNRKIYNIKTAIGILDKLIDTKKVLEIAEYSYITNLLQNIKMRSLCRLDEAE